MLEEKFRLLEDKLNNLLEELQQSRQENRSKAEAIRDLRGQVEQLEALRKEKEAQEEELKALREIAEEAENLQKQVDVQREEIESLEKESGELEKTQAKLAEFDAVLAEKAALQGRVDELEQQASTSEAKEEGIRNRIRMIIEKIDALEDLPGEDVSAGDGAEEEGAPASPAE